MTQNTPLFSQWRREKRNYRERLRRVIESLDGTYMSFAGLRVCAVVLEECKRLRRVFNSKGVKN